MGPSWGTPGKAESRRLYKLLLAAEPHATATKRELRTEAVKKARRGPLFFDLTPSLSKRILIFHASLGETARLARGGDQQGDAYWSALVAEVEAIIRQAGTPGSGTSSGKLDTGTGSDGTRAHGRETGQRQEAHLAVAHWPQHTSRDRTCSRTSTPDRPHRQGSHRGKWGRRIPWVERAHRAVAANPAQTWKKPSRPGTAGMGRARLRRRPRDQGRRRGDDARVLLPPRVDHRRSARPRGAVRAAVRPRAVPARARAPRAGVELHHAQPEARHARSCAGARGLGGQARAHARRLAGVGRAICLACQAAARPRHARRG